MKCMKSILIVSAVVLAGLTLSMLAPKAAHAIAATAVQLMNTSANPVLIDEDNVARQGFTIHGSDLHGQRTPDLAGLPVQRGASGVLAS